MSQSGVMDPELWSFVTRFRDTSGNYNLSSQLSPYTGTFRIERENMDQFWNLFCNRLRDNKKFLSGIGQKPYEHLPLLVDIDLTIKYNNEYDMNEKLYTEHEVKTIIKVYNQVLQDICKSYKRQNSTVLLLEKTRPYRDGEKIKGGFHLHFPNLWFRRCDHDIHIYPRVNRILNDEYPGLFTKLEEQNTGELVDKGVMNKQWLIYGGSKSEKSGSYRFTKAYDFNGNQISLEKAVSGINIYNSDEDPIDISNDLIYHLPRILSIHASSNQEIVNLKTNLECAAKLAIPTAKEKTIQHENINVSDAIKLASELIPMLSAARADSYESWMDVGWTLYCIGDGCQEALDLWIQFSQKTTKVGYFDETYCIKLWSSMISKGKSLGTLKHYAKLDSPEQYEQWCRKKASSHVKEILDGGHEGYANMLYDLYSNVYCTGCLDPKVQWFEYKDHHWKRIEGGHSLRQKINEDIMDILKKEKAKVYIEMGARLENNEDNNDEHENKVIKNIDKNVKQLNNVPFKNSIMTACTYKFYKEDFIDKLDSEKNLMGFSNGVLDLKHLIFRPGVPEDYITLSTGYEFKEFDMSDPDVLEVQDFLMKIFPDDELRTYFIEYAAGLLRGGNTRKTFVVMSGVGDNGKSVLIEMIEQALGKYSIKLPTSLIVGKRTQSSQASPELARTHGVRFAVLQEPDGKDVINQGILKELTGNDTFYNRTLFKEGKDITPIFKLILVCNKLPRLSDSDPATWNRIRVLPFESRFPKDPKEVPKTLEEQMIKKVFLRDPLFNEKIPRLKYAFLWLMLETLKKIDKYGLTSDPDKVTEATTVYRKNNDVFLQYISENIKTDYSNKCSISLAELYVNFCAWYRDSFPNMKVPVKNELKEDLLKRWGPHNDNVKWIGYKIRELKDDIEDSKAILIKSEHLAKDDDEYEIDPEEIDSEETEEINLNTHKGKLLNK